MVYVLMKFCTALSIAAISFCPAGGGGGGGGGCGSVPPLLLQDIKMVVTKVDSKRNFFM
jgi:hypothetical protein